ncbi:MAG: single-stranded-DNA-specific exonuclease RecJ [Eubacteriales bacterium]
MKYRYKKYQQVDIPNQLREAYPELGTASLQVLVNRGYTTAPQVEELLFPEMGLLYRQNMKDIERAVSHLRRAIEQKEGIVVYRDYDCDGCCGGAVAVLGLRGLGATVHHYANERTVDGYGMCVNGVEKLLAQFPDTKLILTVDNGITAHDGIAYAKERGLCVVVTDHHVPSAELPVADAIVDPKRADDDYPFKGLCGAGVVFKVLLALYQSMGVPLDGLMGLLDLVAVATVADVVPILEENRLLVKLGIPLIAEGERPFFRALNSQLGLTEVRAMDTLGFQMGPIINACSRMGLSTDLVVESMISSDLSAVSSVCAQLIKNNVERKTLTLETYERIKEKLVDPNAKAAIFVKDDEIPDGIIGIVAGRLQSDFHRVSLVFTTHSSGVLKCSARGVDGMDLKAALDQLNPDFFLGYGGHPKAAGLTLKADQYEPFCEAFLALTERTLKPEHYTEIREIDLVVDETECTIDLVEELKQLEPFGEGFRPIRCGLNAKVNGVYYMGSEKQHVNFIAGPLSIIHWNRAAWAKGLPSYPEKFVGKLNINSFRGVDSVQFISE